MIKTKTILFSLLLTVFLYPNLKAQQVYDITVKDAVEIAFKNVADIKNAKLDYQFSLARNKEITGMALPQVTGSLQANHYLSLPQIQFPDGTEKAVYDVLRDNGVKDGSGNPITKTGEFSYRNFSFLTPWNINGGISVQQLLFEPQVFVGLLARKELMNNSAIQIDVTEEKVKESVYKNYYAVLIAEKQLVFLKESIKRLEKLSSDMKEMYKNGFVEKLDIDKTTVSLTNTKTIENQLQNGIKIGYAVLKMSLGLSQADSLVLKDILTPEQIKSEAFDESFTFENRDEVRLLNSAMKLQNYDVRRYKVSYAPTLSAFYNLQRNGQRRAGSGGTDKPWFWYTQSLVGLSVNMPIFDGLQKRNKMKQAQFNLEKTENSLQQLKNGIELEKTVAKNNLINAILNMNSQEKNIQLAESVYNTVKKKYEQGVGSSFEVLQADSEMQQAQSNYFKALYDAIIAKISYQKALGKL
jgi:outer membrane protein TolC